MFHHNAYQNTEEYITHLIRYNFEEKSHEMCHDCYFIKGGAMLYGICEIPHQGGCSGVKQSDSSEK